MDKILKIKTKNRTHIIENILDKSSKEFYARYKGYDISINKEKEYKNKWYIQCNHPTGSYIYDGYFNGTQRQAIVDVLENIELDLQDAKICESCNEEMYLDDSLNENEEDLDNYWACHKCNKILKIPSDNVKEDTDFEDDFYIEPIYKSIIRGKIIL